MASKSNVDISNFVKGLITEASPLAFPQGASLDEVNMKLLNDGTRERRLGLNRELDGVVHDTGFTDDVLRDLRISYHDWPMPNNNPAYHIGVVQVGNKLYFIDVTKPNPSAHFLNGGASIAAEVSGDVAVTSTYINGDLLLTCTSFQTPILLQYDEGTDTVSSSAHPILIRDFSGVADGLLVNERPATLSSEHLYNLRNQGWSDDVVVASIAEEQHIGFPEGVGGSSGNIEVGGITVAVISSDTAWDVATKIAAAINGQIPDNATYPIRADANGTNILKIYYDKRDGDVAQITLVDTSTLLAAPPIINTVIEGVDNSAVTAIDAVYAKLGVYPSNSDLVQLGMIPDLTDPDVYSFDADVWYQNSHLSTGEAPKGHYIIDAFNRKASREAVSGITPLVSDTELGRVGVCATYAGRAFYSGVISNVPSADNRTQNASGTLYFGQVGSSLLTLIRAYQEFDPTNKDMNEVLPTDGGVIQIPGCSNVTRMIASESSLFIFSEKGIWELTGGENGFNATEFSVNKISNVGVISPYSIIEINGIFMFWAREGIYRLSRNQFGKWESTSVTIPTIQTMYNSITDEAKKHAKGYYDLSKHQVRWLYHSSGAKVVGSAVDAPPPAYEVIEFLVGDPEVAASTASTFPHVENFNDEYAISVHMPVGVHRPRLNLWTVSGVTATPTEQAEADHTAGGLMLGYALMRVSDTKMILLYKKSTSNAFLRVITRSGSTLSYGTPFDLGTDFTNGVQPHVGYSMRMYNDGKFLIAGPGTGNIFIKTLSIDGSDNITVIDSLSHSPVSQMAYPMLTVLSPTRFIMVFNAGSPLVTTYFNSFSVSGSDVISYDGFSQGNLLTHVQGLFPEITGSVVLPHAAIKRTGGAFTVVCEGSGTVSGVSGTPFTVYVNVTVDGGGYTLGATEYFVDTVVPRTTDTSTRRRGLIDFTDSTYISKYESLSGSTYRTVLDRTEKSLGSRSANVLHEVGTEIRTSHYSFVQLSTGKVLAVFVVSPVLIGRVILG